MLPILQPDLLQLESQLGRLFPELPVAYVFHPSAEGRTPKASVRVDLVQGLAVFLSSRGKSWIGTAVWFDLETESQIDANTTQQMIETDDGLIPWVRELLLNSATDAYERSKRSEDTTPDEQALGLQVADMREDSGLPAWF